MNTMKLARRLTSGVVLALLALVILPGLGAGGPALAQGPTSRRRARYIRVHGLPRRDHRRGR